MVFQSLVEAASSNKFISSTTSTKEINLNWSLKPFQILFKVLTGVNLLSSTQPSSKTTSLGLKWFSWGHIFVFFLVNLAVNVMWSFELIKMLISDDSNEKSEFLQYASNAPRDKRVNNILDYLNSNVFYVGLHLYFLYITCWSSKWDDFWNLMKLTQKECEFNEELFYECRKVVLFAFIFMLMDVLLNFPCSFYDSYWGDYTVIRPFYIFAMNLVYLFEETIICLMIIIVLWTRSFIKILNQRLVEAAVVVSNDKNDNIPQFCYAKLLEWKRQHSLIDQLVERFNRVVRFIVFLFLYYRFVSVITYAFQMGNALIDIQQHKQRDILQYYSFSSFISETFKLCMVVYICHMLQSEGIRLIKNVICINAKLNTTYYPLQNLIDLTLTQVVNCQPIIRASGFCDVNLSLLPTILGSVFTYLIIITDF